MKRRAFVKGIGYSSLAFPLLGSVPNLLSDYDTHHLTILHTNDVHSRIEPFPEGPGRNAGKGGAARRATLIKDIREDVEHVLLLDAGDIFQGTPYFNFFGGELEFKLMDEMSYDAATIGNHDFDAGFEVLNERCQSAKFSMLNANYNLINSPLNKVVKPYQIFLKGDMKIGVFGIGINLDGLVPKKLYGDIEVLPAYEVAERTATLLKKEEKCDLVICLSHLGFQYEINSYLSDVNMAKNTKNIDIIIGGHTHTFLRDAHSIKDKDGESVIINQVGWAGIMLGRIDVSFERGKKRKCYTCKNEFLQNSVDNSIIKYK